MRTSKILSSVVCLAAGLGLGTVSHASQGVIDFEQIPGSSPVEGMTISNQFASMGISFSLQGGGAPVLARVGGTFAAAFLGHPDNTQYDTLFPGQEAGEYFLTDDGGLLVTAPLTIVATFTTPVGSASGVILDVDGTESWRVEAYDANALRIDFIDVNTSSPNAGDGLATGWAFEHILNDISELRFTYTGISQQYVGFALDNFAWAEKAQLQVQAVNAVPLPAGAWSALVTLAGLGAAGLRGKRLRAPLA